MISSSPPCYRALFAAISLSLASSAAAVDIVDDFVGTELDPLTWVSTQPKTVSVGGGQLTWAADGGNWASGDISTVQTVFLPPPGETTSIEWTMGSPQITVQNPNGAPSVRFQLGIHSANESSLQREHWTNTTGGIWLDIDGIVQAVPGSVYGAPRTANDQKVAATQGANPLGEGATVTVDWNWQTESKVFRLDLTDTGYTWSAGGVELVTSTYDVAGIDVEFDNGYRVLALGMNFDAGRGSISVDKVEILNAGEPESIIVGFGGVRPNPVSNERVTLNWVVNPGASVSIDQGIGNVDGNTNTGVGSLVVDAPVVEVPTAVDYTLTATMGAETATRTVTLNVQPAPTPLLTDLFDHFEGAELDAEKWVQQGNKAYSVANSKVTWAADAGFWTTGEVVSVPVFPMPEPGKPTTVTWTLGSASITTLGSVAGQSLRTQLGIVSSFERNTFSVQHYSNVAGGVWLDVEQWGANPNGVIGQFYTANDTKLPDGNGTPLGIDFSIGDWTWGTENHEFSITMTDQGYAWFSGENQLATGTWEAAGLDHEFVNGFKIMGMAGNWSDGSGPISFDSIEVKNGAAIGDPFIITELDYNSATSTISVTWNSKADKTYSFDISTDLNAEWSEEEDSIASQGDVTSYTYTTSETERLFVRIRENVSLAK